MRHKVIYADPPWHFKARSAKGTGRSALSYYDVMSLEALKEYPVQDYTDDDCALFLWCIDPMLPEALQVMKAWGFTYKTVAFHWAKLNKGGADKPVSDNPFFAGMGYWTRANPEICLLGTKGKPKRKAKDVRRFIAAERREHSRKPDEIYDRIERLVDGPYLELFARTSRPGWSSIGDQIESDDKYERRQKSSIESEDDICDSVAKLY